MSKKYANILHGKTFPKITQIWIFWCDNIPSGNPVYPGLAGLALASRSSSDSEWHWEAGKEYVYRYSGRLLTGIPELADVFSGVGINCTVLLQVPVSRIWIPPKSPDRSS
jgi:hypothetical protein